jgi:hypothetical protein
MERSSRLTTHGGSEAAARVVPSGR